jgi:AraC-like DNA-binding protein
MTELYWELNPRVVSAGFYRAAPGYRYRPPLPIIRDYYLWYVAAGAGAIRIDRRWVKFREGDALTILPGRRYEDERADAGAGSEIYFTHLWPLAHASREGNLRLARHWPVRVACAQPTRMRRLFGELFETFTLKPHQHPLRIKAILMEVLGVLLGPPAARAAPSPEATAKLERAQRFIEDHFDQPLDPERMAEHADLSESYLYALFRRHVGPSPMQYLSQVRLRRAAILLAQGASVTTVARQVGFASLHYFSRAFSRQYRQAPTQFARQMPRK